MNGRFEFFSIMFHLKKDENVCGFMKFLDINFKTSISKEKQISKWKPYADFMKEISNEYRNCFVYLFILNSGTSFNLKIRQLYISEY